MRSQPTANPRLAIRRADPRRLRRQHARQTHRPRDLGQTDMSLAAPRCGAGYCPGGDLPRSGRPVDHRSGHGCRRRDYGDVGWVREVDDGA